MRGQREFFNLGQSDLIRRRTLRPRPCARAAATMPELAKMAREGRKIAMLTSYDASFAAICDRVGVDTLLVGDSLGMVVQGHRRRCRSRSSRRSITPAASSPDARVRW